MSNDPVNHPSHYTQDGIECIDAIESALGPEGFVAFLRGQVIKYTWRLGKKDDAVQDASKARWYEDRLINTLKKQQGDGLTNFNSAEWHKNIPEVLTTRAVYVGPWEDLSGKIAFIQPHLNPACPDWLLAKFDLIDGRAARKDARLRKYQEDWYGFPKKDFKLEAK